MSKRLLFMLGGAKAPAIPWYEDEVGTAVAAYQFIGAASLALSKVNLVKPGTYDLSAGNDPSFATATGLTFDGASDYLRTGITCDQSAYSWMIRLDSITNGGYAAGWNNAAGNRFTIIPNQGTGVQYRYGDETEIPAPTLTSGTVGLAGGWGWRNGVKDTTTQATIAASTAVEIWIGCLNNNGSPLSYMAGNVLAFIVWATAPTDAQLLKASQNMLALTAATPPF